MSRCKEARTPGPHNQLQQPTQLKVPHLHSAANGSRVCVQKASYSGPHGIRPYPGTRPVRGPHCPGSGSSRCSSQGHASSSRSNDPEFGPQLLCLCRAAPSVCGPGAWPAAALAGGATYGRKGAAAGPPPKVMEPASLMLRTQAKDQTNGTEAGSIACASRSSISPPACCWLPLPSSKWCCAGSAGGQGSGEVPHSPGDP